MNIRELLIQSVLDSQLTASISPMNAVEIGCMYNESEGMSTYRIAKTLRDAKIKFTFTSLEYSQEHIANCRKIISKNDPELLKTFEFIQGHSLKHLPQLVQKVESIHFALIDGGAHPEVNLCEFEIILEKLDSKGVIIIDDTNQISTNANYFMKRVFGKATLLYPSLIISEYMLNRNRLANANFEEGDAIEYHSNYLQRNYRESGLFIRDNFDYAMISYYGHALILFGNKNILEQVLKTIKTNEKKFTFKKIKRAIKVMFEDEIAVL